MVDVVAEAEGQDEGGGGVVRIGEFGDGFADFGDGGVFGVDVHVADDGAVAMEADGSVLDVEVDHGGAGDLLEELVVFAAAEGGDVGEAIVFVDGFGVGIGGVERTREDVEDGDAMADGEPMVNGKREREGGVVAVRREDENVQEKRAPRECCAWEESELAYWNAMAHDIRAKVCERRGWRKDEAGRA